MSKIPKIKPRAKYVFVKQDDAESKVSEYGIVTPDNVEDDKKAFGTILEVGSGISDLKKGERVIFGVFAGETIEFKEAKGLVFKILHDDDVLAVMPN